MKNTIRTIIIDTFFIVGVASVLMLGGCSGKSAGQSATDGPQVPTKQIDPAVWDKLAAKDISPEFLALFVLSPDGDEIALALDSMVRIEPGDEMWAEGLPSDWFGMRNRQLLYVYDIPADSLVLVKECDQIVNFYHRTSSQPVEQERWQEFAALAWSPDGAKLLLVNDHQETGGRRFQNALVYTMGVDDPVYLELFTYCQELVKQTPGSNVTTLTEASWVDEATVRIVLASAGGEVSLNLTFSAETGELVSTR